MNAHQIHWKWRTCGEFVYSKKQLLLAAVLLSLIACFYPRYLPFILLLCSFTGGVLVCYLTFRPDSLLPNLLTKNVRTCNRVTVEDELTVLKRLCPVCEKRNCKQHWPELNVLALQPWTNLELPHKVDEALEEFLNLVLKEYVYTWYRDLSKDEAFVDELRSSLRFISAVLLRRLQKVDLPSFIITKVLRIVMKHLHFYLEAAEIAGAQNDMEEYILRYYGRNLHIALRNRQTEMDYLRNISQRLFPFILPPQSLKCRSLCVLLWEILSAVILLPVMDLIANPDTINILLRLFLDKTPIAECTEPPSKQVSLLANFATPNSKGNSSLHIELTELLQNSRMLYAFMQFMKTEASVNVLQFYLTVEQFNNKLLRPELSEREMHDLHDELCELYMTYCDPGAIDRVKFSAEICSQLKQICDSPAEDIIILQTSTPLFRAYEHAYDLLQNKFLPLFHQSDDYYTLICGERLPTRLQRNMPRAAVRMGDLLSLSKLGNKIKGVFKNNTVDGGLPDIDYTADEAEGSENEDPTEEFGGGGGRGLRRGWEGPLHDLSAWRVTIPELIAAPEPDNPRRSYSAFLVEVRRVDVLENDFEASRWSVERRYHEFYALEQKLIEFHGEFDNLQLPPKKSFGTKSITFLESRMAPFEQYLQKLLTMPNLRGSELLYSFFTSDDEFSTNFLPDINLGKVLNSTAVRLVMKEKGQNLDMFLQSFLQSTESSKSRPCKWSDKDSDTISISSEKMANTMFDNNANMDLSLPDKQASLITYLPLSDAYDTLLYLVRKVYAAPQWLLQVLISLRMLVKQTLDTYLDHYLHYKLGILLHEQQVVHLIHLLRDAIFFDVDPPRSEEVKKDTKDLALQELLDYIPKIFVGAIGRSKHKHGTKLMFDILQLPKLNKQLSYTLLDEVLAELFPELVTTSPKSPNGVPLAGRL